MSAKLHAISSYLFNSVAYRANKFLWQDLNLWQQINCEVCGRYKNEFIYISVLYYSCDFNRASFQLFRIG